MNTSFAGIENTTDKPQVLMYDAESTYFKPKEVRILPKVLVDHAVTRLHVFQEKLPGGKLGPVVGKYIFKQIPLADALKVATVEEDQSLVEARRLAEQKEREKQDLINSLKDQLVAEGWVRPAAKEAKK